MSLREPSAGSFNTYTLIIIHDFRDMLHIQWQKMLLYMQTCVTLKTVNMWIRFLSMRPTPTYFHTCLFNQEHLFGILQ